MVNIVHVVSEDWEGLYVNGKLYDEGHSIPLDTFKHALSDGWKSWEDVELVGAEWLALEGSLPSELLDLYLKLATEG